MKSSELLPMLRDVVTEKSLLLATHQRELSRRLCEHLETLHQVAVYSSIELPSPEALRELLDAYQTEQEPGRIDILNQRLLSVLPGGPTTGNY